MVMMYLNTQDTVDVSAWLSIVITKASINDHTIVSYDFLVQKII